MATDSYPIPVLRREHPREIEPHPPIFAQSLAPTPLRFEPLDLFNSFDTYLPSPEEMFDAFVRGMTGRGLPKSGRVRGMNVEIVLSQAEAEQGGRLPINFPVARLCARCDGTGRTGFFRCDACEGHGLIWRQARVEFDVRRATPDGTLAAVSLRHLGAHPPDLIVHVRVTGANA